MPILDGIGIGAFAKFANYFRSFRPWFARFCFSA